jgi:hypothetical protein
MLQCSTFQIHAHVFPTLGSALVTPRGSHFGMDKLQSGQREAYSTQTHDLTKRWLSVSRQGILQFSPTALERAANRSYW